jgi:hypothetical protein
VDDGIAVLRRRGGLLLAGLGDERTAAFHFELRVGHGQFRGLRIRVDSSESGSGNAQHESHTNRAHGARARQERHAVCPPLLEAVPNAPDRPVADRFLDERPRQR